MALQIGIDSFTSVADADAYWTDHSGGTGWAAALSADKEAALREASQYIDKSYSWRGDHPGDASQLLSWPRYNVIDRQGRVRSSTEVPAEVKDATAWLAEQALSGELLPAQARGGRIKGLKAGSVQVEYEDNAPAQSSYDYVDLLVSGLIKGGKNTTILLKG